MSCETPSVAVVMEQSTTRREEYERFYNERSEKREQEIQELCDLYKERLYKCINTAISRCKRTDWISVRDVFTQDLTTRSGRRCPVHFVHYGNYSSMTSWRERVPFCATRNVFREVQRELHAKGWFLLDMSNPARSFATVICLCGEKPTDYGNTRIWHGLNVLPDDIKL